MMNRREFSRMAAAVMSVMAAPELGFGGMAGESAEARALRLAWWKEARFGMFIHWGLYAAPAGEWKGRRIPKSLPNAEWIMSTLNIPKPEYEKFAAGFNPAQFNAREWAKIAKNAGMKYLVITSKHHDGFSMFDSKLTSYDIVDAAPFHRDPLKELAQACADEGIRFGIYYSQLDWHWATSSAAAAYIPDFPKYMEFMTGQLKELLTNYGPIGSLFFDGDWMPQWNNRWGEKVERLCHELQPGVVINDRLQKRPLVKDLMVTLGRGYSIFQPQIGDYATPEQVIPDKLPACDWETCMTMNRTWGYCSFDQDWKPATDLVRKLIDIASKGGNWLLNVGPTAQGLIPAPSVERLAEVGKWMQVNGESIYGTQAGPQQALPWGRSTAKPGRIFLHVFDWPKGPLPVPGLSRSVKKAYLLADRDKTPLELKTGSGQLLIAVPEQAPDPTASVVVLEVE